MCEKISFESEYALHKLTENKLEELFELKHIASEIQKDNLRFDTMAFDENENAFVIIEYKNVLNPDVLNQVKEYYDLLLEKPNDYVNRLDNYKNVVLENTRVMIIGQEFSDSQIEESKKLPFPVEFYIISLFKKDDEKGCVTYSQVNDDFHKKLEIDLDSIRITEDKVLNDKTPEITGLFKSFKNRLSEEFNDLDLKYIVDGVSIKYKKNYICLVNVKKAIKIIYYTKKLDDNKNQTRNISNVTTGGLLADYELTLREDNVDYAIDLIKQVYTQKVIE